MTRPILIKKYGKQIFEQTLCNILIVNVKITKLRVVNEKKNTDITYINFFFQIFVVNENEKTQVWR